MSVRIHAHCIHKRFGYKSWEAREFADVLRHPSQETTIYVNGPYCVNGEWIVSYTENRAACRYLKELEQHDSMPGWGTRDEIDRQAAAEGIAYKRAAPNRSPRPCYFDSYRDR